jgi:hypothetical protein
LSVLLPVAALSCCLVLLFVNFRLNKSLGALRQQLGTFEIASAPAEGSHLSQLKGVGLDGKPMTYQFTKAPARSLVMVLSPQCKFCEETLPAWKTLTASAGPRNSVYADLSGSLDEQYVKSSGLGTNSHFLILDPIEGALHRFRGTPTTLVLDNNGKILKSWAGILDASKTNEFAEALASSKQRLPN